MVDEEDYSYNHYHSSPRAEVHPGYDSQGLHHEHGGSRPSTGGNEYHGTINSQPMPSQPIQGHNGEVRPAVEPEVDIASHVEVHGH